MLKLTKKTDYGMMAMRYLAEHADNGPHSARDIADAYSIPLTVLAKTLQALARAELVASQHGAMGGYVLARSAHRISAFDVISAFNGPPVITSCNAVHGTCDMITHCTVKEPLRRVNDSIKALLCNMTVADLTEPAYNSKIPTKSSLVSIFQ